MLILKKYFKVCIKLLNSNNIQFLSKEKNEKIRKNTLNKSLKKYMSLFGKNVSGRPKPLKNRLV